MLEAASLKALDLERFEAYESAGLEDEPSWALAPEIKLLGALLSCVLYTLSGSSGWLDLWRL